VPCFNPLIFVNFLTMLWDGTVFSHPMVSRGVSQRKAGEIVSSMTEILIAITAVFVGSLMLLHILQWRRKLLVDLAPVNPAIADSIEQRLDFMRHPTGVHFQDLRDTNEIRRTGLQLIGVLMEQEVEVLAGRRDASWNAAADMEDALIEDNPKLLKHQVRTHANDFFRN